MKRTIYTARDFILDNIKVGVMVLLAIYILYQSHECYKLYVSINDKADYIEELETIYNTLKNENDLLYNEIILMQNEMVNITNDLKLAKDTIAYAYTVNADLYDLIEESNASVISLQKELDNATERLTTYEKYKYIVINEIGGRTDVTYEQLKLGETKMLEKGYDPDVLFGMIKIESNGKEKATNKYSGAAGYGQFMKLTGKYVYEDLLNMGKYDHNITPYNGSINIIMMVAYIDKLYNTYDGNIFKSIKQYCGGDDKFAAGYINNVNKNIPGNKSVYNIDITKNQ